MGIVGWVVAGLLKSRLLRSVGGDRLGSATNLI